jgi:hypothetical protein
MEVSSSAALGHTNNFMHPQAIIIDNSGAENPYFLTGMRDRSSLLGKTLIYLPPNPEQHLMWIARLDSASLNGMYSRSNCSMRTNIFKHLIKSALTS